MCSAKRTKQFIENYYSKISPSREITTTRHGRNFPLAFRASVAACSSPPQQRTSSRTIINQLGIVLEGRVQIESTDFWGKKTILDSLGEGKVFAETYTLTKVPLMVDVVATQESKSLLLQTGQLNSTQNACSKIIIKNLLTISMKKNLHLSQRIFHTSSKTIRGRLLSYLSSHVPHGTPNAEFDIPFDRSSLPITWK